MLDKIEKLLGVENDLVVTVYSLTEERFKQILGGVEDVPTELEYIVVEAAVRRYNRIGAEGASSHSVEGESFSWSDSDDFAGFEEEINDWLMEQEEAKRGVVRFL